MGHCARMIPDRVITTIGAEAEARIGRVSPLLRHGLIGRLNARVTITELKFAMLGLRAWSVPDFEESPRGDRGRRAIYGSSTCRRSAQSKASRGGTAGGPLSGYNAADAAGEVGFVDRAGGEPNAVPASSATGPFEPTKPCVGGCPVRELKPQCEGHSVLPSDVGSDGTAPPRIALAT